jgi:hypothetical protein
MSYTFSTEQLNEISRLSGIANEYLGFEVQMDENVR